MIEKIKLSLAIMIKFLDELKLDILDDRTDIYLSGISQSEINSFMDERIVNETQNDQDIESHANYFSAKGNLLLSFKADKIKIHLGFIYRSNITDNTEWIEQNDNESVIVTDINDYKETLDRVTSGKYSSMMEIFRSHKDRNLTKEDLSVDNTQIVKAIVDTVVKENKEAINTIKKITDVTDLAIKSSDVINKVTQDVRSISNSVGDAAALQAVKKVLFLALQDADNDVNQPQH